MPLAIRALAITLVVAAAVVSTEGFADESVSIRSSHDDDTVGLPAEFVQEQASRQVYPSPLALTFSKGNAKTPCRHGPSPRCPGRCPHSAVPPPESVSVLRCLPNDKGIGWAG